MDEAPTRARRPSDLESIAAVEIEPSKARRGNPLLVAVAGLAAAAAILVVAIPRGSGSESVAAMESREAPVQPEPVPRQVTVEFSEWEAFGEELDSHRVDADQLLADNSEISIDELQWVHPLPDVIEVCPTTDSRKFGASRPGNRPSECRRGHCGVDLDNPRGSPIVAVADAVVIHAERSAYARGGRYVRLAHRGGWITSYFHLDDVAAGLKKGDPVKAGQLIGSLGRTGIRNSDPHLHFSLEMKRNKIYRYVDPDAVLRRAEVLGLLDIRTGVAPIE
jgi:murein DD-endopeptidase MepM/ murein hydrolase activator NlpD